MIKTLRQIANMKATLWVNAFCFYFKRLWLVGKWMPDTVYSNYNLKKILSVAAVIIQQLLELCGKPLYLLSFVGLPLLFMPDYPLEMGEQKLAALVQILFFLNCIIGAFGSSQIFTVTRDKVTCIKYLHMNARSCIQSGLAYKYVPFFLYYLPCLLAAVHILGGSLLQGILLWIMLISFRLMGEAFQLRLFERTGKVISRSMSYNWAIIIVGLAGAYLPIGLGWRWPMAAILLHPLCAVVYGAFGAFSLWYITVGSHGYERSFHRAMDPAFLLSGVLKASSGSAAAFKAVEIQESDGAMLETSKEKYEKLKGYTYINALFFARHRRQLVKPVYYRLAGTAVLFAAVVVLWIVSRETAAELSGNLTAMLPVFVYIMYFMTVADKASRAMFYNCDKDMLRYAYYRQPKTILKNFTIRLLRISLYDIAVAGSVCLAAIAFCVLCATTVFTMDMLLFCTTILLLSVLFTAHHLCLYYIFQPYSESLQIKNPFYSVINAGMYILCFLCLKIEVGGFVFTAAVLAFTIIYIAAALVLVYRFAPKNFRIK